MKESGWDVNWSDKRKHIVFQNQDGKKVRDSNLSKTFHLDISKEVLESEFNRNEEKERTATGRNQREDDALDRYYRQLEEVVAGAGRGDRIPDEGTGQAAGRMETTCGIDTKIYRGKSSVATGGKSEDIIRQSQLARRTSEAANRVVQNAEHQSIFTEEQRRSAEQKWRDEQERAKVARRKNRRRYDPEL